MTTTHFGMFRFAMELRRTNMELECESSFQSLDESEGSAAYEGDVSLAESFASVDQYDGPVSETESETTTSSQPITSGAPPNLSWPTTSSPYTGVVRKTRLTTKLQPSLRYHAINARQQAALIQAKTRIVQLQSEVSSLQHASKRARIEEAEEEVVSKSGDQMLSIEQEERLQQLEAERCELLKELASAKEKLSDSEGHLVEYKEQVEELTDSYKRDTQELKGEIEDLKSELDDVTLDNDNLHTQLTQFQLQAAQMKIFEIEKLQEAHDRSVHALKSRIHDLECVESKLVHSEAEVKQLQRSMRAHKQDYYFVESEKEKLFKYNETERQLRQITEQNTLLRKQRDNADLLKYKVQSLQEKCAMYEGLKANVAELELTNQQLRKQIEEGQEEGGEMKAHSGGGQPALQYRIAELQHKEVLLLSKQGELLTSVKLAESAAAEATQCLEEVKRKLAKEEELVQSKDERIQKLEKRLLFVTKERDGCVNVLNSYRLDAGVDAILKEQVTELEQQLARAKERIAELESEVDGHTKTSKQEDTHNQ